MTQPIFFFAEINLKHPWIAGGKLTIDEKYLGIMSGETHIEARLFNALGYAIYQDSHVCKLFIYEDFAHSKPTVDNCKSVEQFDKIVTREIKKVDLHWYSIELTHTEIHCQTSVIQQVPTYYTIQDGTLLISSDMHDMMHKKGDILTLNYSHLATLLLRNWGYTHSTVFETIFLHTSNTILSYKQNVLRRSVKKFDDSPKCEGASSISDLEAFGKAYASFMKERFKSAKCHIATELSGGFDSSICTKTVMDTTGKQPNTYTLILHDKQRFRQKKKIRAFCDAYKVKNYCTRTKNLYPLSPNGLLHRNVSHYILDELYQDCLDDLINKAEINKEDIIVTGIGGDECCIALSGKYNKTDKEHFDWIIDSTDSVPEYLTNTIREALHDTASIRENPRPAIPDSLLDANNSRSRIFLSHNIWPVSGFASVGLFALLNNRAGKNPYLKKKFFFKYAKQIGLPSVISGQKIPDRFGSLCIRGLAEKNNAFFLQLLRQPLLEKFKVINPGEFLSIYEKYVHGDQKEFIVVLLLALEITLCTVFDPHAKELHKQLTS